MSVDVSVVMSVKNGEKYLIDSIESILNQTIKNFEFLIFDDGSFDKTSEILKKYEARDSRIKVFSCKDSIGLPNALNKLIKISAGDYIARMDSDDIAHHDRLKTQLYFMKNNPLIDICFTKTNLITENGIFLCEKWFPKNIKLAIFLMPYINYFVHPTCLAKKECFYKYGFYNKNFLKAQDWELWQRFISKGVRFGYISDTLMNYRIVLSGNSASLSNISYEDPNWLNAKLLIVNHRKLSAIRYFNKISKRNLFTFFIYMIVPRFIFIFYIIINKHINNQSVLRKLLDQDEKS
jgi:glycosyltransferase involved in cell wall biosynthesis